MAGNEKTRGNVSHKHKIEMCVPWGGGGTARAPNPEISDISPVSPVSGYVCRRARSGPRTARLAASSPRLSPRIKPRITPIALPLSPSQRLNNLESVFFSLGTSAGLTASGVRVLLEQLTITNKITNRSLHSMLLSTRTAMRIMRRWLGPC
jgi:hypothetical protein